MSELVLLIKVLVGFFLSDLIGWLFCGFTGSLTFGLCFEDREYLVPIYITALINSQV